jgi:hypothetical protein
LEPIFRLWGPEEGTPLEPNFFTELRKLRFEFREAEVVGCFRVDSRK